MAEVTPVIVTELRKDDIVLSKILDFRLLRILPDLVRGPAAPRGGERSINPGLRRKQIPGIRSRLGSAVRTKCRERKIKSRGWTDADVRGAGKVFFNEVAA